MKQEIIKSLTKNFESYVNKTENDIEFWFARDLGELLGYTEWRNFLNTIFKAKTACELSGGKIADHFVDINKTIKMPKTAEKTIPDIMLTRYACYLIAQNGDSKKQEIAFAQTYFATQTRKFEIIEKKIQELERLQARQKLSETEKQLSGVIFQQTGDNKNFAFIRSKGDKALFGYTTQEMKNKLGVPKSRPLSDFQPTIILKAKDFATEITIFNTKEKALNTEQNISDEHISNNASVRGTLISRGIYPEQLPAEKDVKKVGRKLKSDEKKSLKDLDKDKLDK
jgi:DNA-damage-inducible protein D